MITLHLKPDLVLDEMHLLLFGSGSTLLEFPKEFDETIIDKLNAFEGINYCYGEVYSFTFDFISNDLRRRGPNAIIQFFDVW